MKKINVLGTEYKVIIATKDEKESLKTRAGYMDWSIKEIVVEKENADEDTVKCLHAYTKKIMRHEIIHAFLYESGLWENSDEKESWANNEEMTDWFAIQFPKIQKVYTELNILE